MTQRTAIPHLARRRRDAPAAAVAAIAVLLGATAAYADDVLEGTAVVRRNSLYRAGRQEIGATFGMSLGDPYVRNLLPGARYDFHLTDWIALGAQLMVGVPIDTAMKAQIADKVSKHNETFTMETSRLGLIIGPQASVAPLSGKFMVLGFLPAQFDFHVNLGAGIASTPGIVTTAAGSPPPSIGVAPWVGAGGRLFLSRVIALTVDLNNFFVKRTLSVDRNGQPPGAAYAGQLVFTGGVSFFVPPDLKRAD